MKISNKYKNTYFFDKLSQEEEINNKILKFSQKLKKKYKLKKNIKKKYTNKLLENFKNKQKNIQ
jgi:hypothetical protein